MSGWREYSTRSSSAGGQEEQPWLVNSSTTARGGSAQAGCRRADSPRAARANVKRDAMMPLWNMKSARRETHVTLSGCRRPPAAVHPQPLLRVFPHPFLHHGGHGLHGALHVDLPVGIPREIEGRRELQAEAMAGE